MRVEKFKATDAVTHVLSVHLPVVAIAEDVRVRSSFCGRLGVQSSVNSIYCETEPSCRNNATALNMNSFVVLSAFLPFFLAATLPQHGTWMEAARMRFEKFIRD